MITNSMGNLITFIERTHRWLKSKGSTASGISSKTDIMIYFQALLDEIDDFESYMRYYYYLIITSLIS